MNVTAPCQHAAANADMQFVTFHETGQWMAELRVRCATCGLPFLFQGLPTRLSRHAASVSVDGQEARLPLAPAGTVPTPADLMLAQATHLSS